MLALVIGLGGALVLTASVLAIAFALVRRAINRAAEALQVEGVELDSGMVRAMVRYRGYRAPGGVHHGGVRVVPARVVLTSRRLHLVQRPQRVGVFERSDLTRFTVSVGNHRLVLHSDAPPGASGSITYVLRVPDPERWVAALRAAGAQAA